MKKLLAATAAVVAGLIGWIYTLRSAPPEVPFARVTRQQLISTLVTNGAVEPAEWVAVRAERSGLVSRVLAARGQPVARSALIAETEAAEARAELAAAEARIAQVQAEIEVLKRGGRATDLADIENSLRRARQELDAARADYEALDRLAKKNAATGVEVDQARRRMEKAELEIRSLENRRRSLVSEPDRETAEAKLREAHAAADQARRRIERSAVRAPMAGLVYNLPVRIGSFLNPGDLVAEVGRLDTVRVTVYVDEPELGRVGLGMPVTITWDARPGRSWKGTVEKLPTRIVALGTRQVGEVICLIGNPGGELLPGTNVSAEIRSSVADNALTIPKEALRRRAGQPGAFLLESDRIVWRALEAGISSVTRLQVVRGLSEGDAVALAADRPLVEGQKVKPVFP